MRLHRSDKTLYFTESRGYALATVLMIVGVILIISLGMASVSMLQLNMAVNSNNQMKAQMAAESELNKALFTFIRNPDFGKDGGCDSWFDEYTGTRGRVSFSQKESFFSTYNLENKSAVAGWNRRSVPPNSVHVISTGDCGNTRRCMEMIVKKELFPYALATTSRIETQNSPLWIEGVKNTSSFLAGIKDRPGNIHSNHTSGIAIEAPEKSYINGTASAVGNIRIGMPSDITGGIKPYSGAVEVPVIAVDSFDPKNTLGVVKIGKGSYTGLKLNSLHRCDGDIEIQGNLEMKDAVLYTTGDILVSGIVTGNGAMMSKGKVTIGKTAALSATNQIAIIADKDVTVAGDPRQESFFQGLIYTHGNFYGQNFTLLGNLIAQSAEESKGKAVLKDMKIVYNEEATGITINTAVSSTPPPPEGVAVSRNWNGHTIHSGTATIVLGDNYCAFTYRITDRERFNAAVKSAEKDFSKITELDKYAESYLWMIQDGASKGVSKQFIQESLSDPDRYLTFDNKYCHTNSVTDAMGIKRWVRDGVMFDRRGKNGKGGKAAWEIYQGWGSGDDSAEWMANSMLDCMQDITSSLSTEPNGSAGLTDAPLIVTDLTLNKYLTRILPTRVTFQGEMP